jgi:hypothetical protein
MSVLLSTSYLPSISIISTCFRSEEVIIEGFETYSKQTCRNHCVIYGPNGPQKLSIPVIKVFGNHTMVKDMQISYDSSWQKIHWRSIETAYNNSPFFLYYRDQLEPFYTSRISNLLEFNTKLFIVLLKILGSEIKIRFTDHYSKEPENVVDKRALVNKKPHPGNYSWPEYRQTFHPKFGFIPNLSVIDLIFNLGPEAIDYVQALEVLSTH